MTFLFLQAEAMLDQALIKSLEGIVGSEKVLTSDEDVADRRHDYWVLSHLQSWVDVFEGRPGAVISPSSVEEVQAVVRLASETNTAVVPFGLGSGVCGGVRPDQSMILIDLSGLNQIREIDAFNLKATFDAGVNGLHAEESVTAHGSTIGHWPQSIALSSVGGWVSTRAAGQFSTAYGNIEDMVYSLEVVLPNGDLVILGKAPRAAAGPDLRHLLIGAEGTMGIITGVTLCLRQQPERREYRVFHTPSLAAGIEAQRRILQAGWLPPVMRQYDERETRRTFKSWCMEGHGLLLMVHEGPEGRVEAEVNAIDDLAESCGLVLGHSAAGEHWMENRNHVPTWDELFDRGLIVDTVEVSSSWSDIETLYDKVIEAVSEISGVVAVSAHSSHAYRTGINLYFSFAATAENPIDLEPIYLECWKQIMEKTAECGGGIAHHHGVGRVRKPYLVHDLGESGLALLRNIKNALDPQGLLNPGNLIPDA